MTTTPYKNPESNRSKTIPIPESTTGNAPLRYEKTRTALPPNGGA